MSRSRTVPLLAVLLLTAAGGILWGAFAARENQRLEGARRELERRIGSLDLARLAPAEVPPVENAAIILMRASESQPVPPPTMPHAASRLGGDVLAQLSEEQREELASFVAAHSQELSLARRAVAATGSAFGIDYDAGPHAELPDFSRFVRLGKLLLVEARLSLDEGNYVLAEANLATLHSLRTALSNEPILISQLVAMTIDGYFLEAVQLFLHRQAHDREVLELALAMLNEREIVADLKNGLTGEAVMAANWSLDSRDDQALRKRVGLERISANMLEDYIGWLDRESIDRDQLEAEIERRSRTASADKGPLYVGYPQQLLKAQALESSSQLARHAIGLAVGQTDQMAETNDQLSGIQLATDRFSGRAPVLAVANDGGSELVLQPAEEIWNRHYPDPSAQPAPRFRWRLTTANPPTETDSAADRGDGYPTTEPPRAG